ncbi:hypothetical protein D7294_30285 [Streptomyces hoynatensis]|uniref:Uncharacterized protein n=1 Tax=Streptomyces hoynatensis TaxID=1141874 RepID=A0A3A9YFP9_9ACTN|nr:hypothetical protein D7294_30285 [Streptomyces hoynatensis]
MRRGLAVLAGFWAAVVALVGLAVTATGAPLAGVPMLVFAFGLGWLTRWLWVLPADSWEARRSR